MFLPVEAFTGDPDALFERAERRVTTLLVGKLHCAGTHEHLCRVRNISESGMLIETHRPLGFASWVSVELRSGERLEGTVAWSGTGRAGVKFVSLVDVDRILQEAKIGSAESEAARPRAPRFDVECPARMVVNGRSIDVTVENISQSGARLRLPRPPKVDTELILTVPGLPARRASARWTTEDTVGLSFNDIIPYHELGAWLEHVGH